MSSEIVCMKCGAVLRGRSYPRNVSVGFSFGRCKDDGGLFYSVPEGCVVIDEECDEFFTEVVGGGLLQGWRWSFLLGACLVRGDIG